MPMKITISRAFISAMCTPFFFTSNRYRIAIKCDGFSWHVQNDKKSEMESESTKERKAGKQKGDKRGRKRGEERDRETREN